MIKMNLLKLQKKILKKLFKIIILINIMSLDVEQYKMLSNYYIDTVKELFNYSKEENLIPLSCKIFLPFANEYIEDNKLSIIENGLEYLLKNKEYILNFSIENLNNTENKNIINEFKDIIDKNNVKEVKLIFDIIENAKKLNNYQQKIFKEYIEIIILILEKINNLLG
jgi:hypothetical protein